MIDKNMYYDLKRGEENYEIKKNGLFGLNSYINFGEFY